jgi:hypothetical protein
MAQTTRLASFGPVFAVATFYLPPCPYIVDYNLNMLLSIIIYEENRRDTHLWPKRRQTSRLGPLSSPPPSISLPVLIS